MPGGKAPLLPESTPEKERSEYRWNCFYLWLSLLATLGAIVFSVAYLTAENNVHLVNKPYINLTAAANPTATPTQGHIVAVHAHAHANSSSAVVSSLDMKTDESNATLTASAMASASAEHWDRLGAIFSSRYSYY